MLQSNCDSRGWAIGSAIVFVLVGLTLPLVGVVAEPLGEFEACKAELLVHARKADVTEATLDIVFPTLEKLPRVIASDRSQPEFTQTFTEYYEKRVTPFRVTRGRELLNKHRALLDKITTESGVPGHYLVAFWGLETNFGTYFGKLPIPRALATLACDQRRSEFFRTEFIATLRIIDAGDMKNESMIGSWAGALGHMQFMPTTFLAHARDGDGDGKRDLIGSIPDAMTSAGAYLKAIGWQRGYRWGREILIPRGFDYSQTGWHQPKPLSTWSQLGVTDAHKTRLAASDISSRVLVPTGHEGPAFVVYDNFEAIMSWNRSEFYAIAVGRLADRIAGAGRLQTNPPGVEKSQISVKHVKQLQTTLNQLGFDAGKPDGVIGRQTRFAIQKFQAENDQIADGYPRSETISEARRLKEVGASP